MDKLTYFKNFNMGRELKICGDFLYESMRAMYSFRSFHEHFAINKILYFGSVGIEYIAFYARIRRAHKLCDASANGKFRVEMPRFY